VRAALATRQRASPACQQRDPTARPAPHLDADAVVIAEVFAKTTQTKPAGVIKNSQRRLSVYDDATKG
jgi:hypothetical protein